MKKMFFLSLALGTFTAVAQTTPNTQNPAPPGTISANPNGATPTTPGQNPLSSTVLSNVIGMAGNYLSNRFQVNNPMAVSNAMVYSNLFGGENIDLANVEGLLQNLQLDIEQALPIIASLTGQNRNGTIQNGAATVPGVNPGIGNRAIGTPAVPGVGQGQLPATGNPGYPYQRGTVPGQPAYPNSGQMANNGQTVYGMLGTNTFQMNRVTYQQLMYLENNLRQTLPVLQSLNGSAGLENGTAAVNPNPATGGFTNRFMRVPQNRGVLLPTGR